MKYLLDTCVISELIRQKPDNKVLSWMNERSENDLYISVLTLGEIRRGITKLSDQAKKSKLLDWYIELENRFSSRIIPVDIKIAEEWGGIQGELDKTGNPMSVIDGLLAVTALVHNLVVVTRNTSDFHIQAVEILNPWL